MLLLISTRKESNHETFFPFRIGVGFKVNCKLVFFSITTP